MNELREKIKNATGTVIKSYPDNQMKLVQTLEADKIDAILDAVIAALPSPPEDWKTHPLAKAMKEQYDYTVEILKEAKESK